MAMTAWAAKFVTSSICFSVNGRTSAVDADRADQFAVLEHRHVEQRARSSEFGGGDAKRLPICVDLLRLGVFDVDGLLGGDDPAQSSRWTRPDRPAIEKLCVFRGHADLRNRV